MSLFRVTALLVMYGIALSAVGKSGTPQTSATKEAASPDDIPKSKGRGRVRYLLELKLWECSLVVLPMNPLAQVTGVKTLEDILRSSSTSFEPMSPCAANTSGARECQKKSSAF
jgi:hypothetical protein